MAAGEVCHAVSDTEYHCLPSSGFSQPEILDVDSRPAYAATEAVMAILRQRGWSNNSDVRLATRKVTRSGQLAGASYAHAPWQSLQ